MVHNPPKSRSRRRAVLALAVMAAVFSLQCAGRKKTTAAPTPEGLEHQSYPVEGYLYEASAPVKASPLQITELLFHDLDWVGKVAAGDPAQTLRAEIAPPAPGFDLLKPSSILDLILIVNARTVPAHALVMQNQPDKAIWVLLYSGPNWLVARIEIHPAGGGATLRLNVLADLSTLLGPDTDSSALMPEAAARLDFFLASLQSRFDPALAPEQRLARGTHGEFSPTLLQAYMSSIHIQAKPEAITAVTLDDQAFEETTGNLKYEGQCTLTDQLYYCPMYYDFLGRKIRFDAFSVGDVKAWLHYETYMVWLQYFSVLQTRVVPEGDGSRMSYTFITEIPAGAGAGLTDLMVFLTGTPQDIDHALLKMKEFAEQR
jgi:hypothetical protein